MLAWLVLLTGLSAAGTWLARRYAIHRELLDHPGERRSHQVATPRGGGVAVVATLLVACLVLAVRDPSQHLLLGGFAAGLMLVAGIGLADDHRPLSPWIRLLVHAAAGVLFGLALGVSLGSAWLGIAAFAAVLVLSNVWNFMDGINGIAASQSLLLGVGLAIVGGSWGLLALALAAASLGFLPYNFPRARIFLGDVGSGAIGFAIAALAVITAGRMQLDAVWLLLPLSAFLVDAGLTLARRILRGEQWWTAHTQHAYQVWARRRGHTFVTLAYAGWTLLGLFGMTLFSKDATTFIWLIPGAWYIGAAVAWWLIQGTEWRRLPDEKD